MSAGPEPHDSNVAPSWSSTPLTAGAETKVSACNAHFFFTALLGDEKPHTTTPLATGEPTNARAKANAQVRLRGGTDTDASPEAFNDPVAPRGYETCAEKYARLFPARKALSDSENPFSESDSDADTPETSEDDDTVDDTSPEVDDTKRAYAADTLWTTLQRERLR